MKVDDIRPEELVEENLRLYHEDLEVFMKGRGKFVHVPCPACGEWPSLLAFVKDGFAHWRCQRCGTLFISPRPTMDMLMDFYSNAKSIRHWNERLYPQTEDSRRKSIFAPRGVLVIELCSTLCVHPGTLMDVGAGFGTFCSELATVPFFERILAVEPSHELAESCRERGVEVLEAPIERVELCDVDFVTCFELIEHMFRPTELVDACHRALVPGGVLLLTTPNIRGFELDILGKAAVNIGGPTHLQLFTPGSIEGLLEAHGFDIVNITTPGSLDAETVRSCALSGELDLSGRPFLERVLLREWGTAGPAFQEFLVKAGMSSHMQVVARKRG